jgi:hypothetical protein
MCEEERENAPWRRILTHAKWIYTHVVHTMLCILTSVQSVDVDISIMMRHHPHRQLCCHGPQCNGIDPKKNIMNPNVGRYG